MKAIFVYTSFLAVSLTACTTGSMLTSRPVYDDLYYSSRAGGQVQMAMPAPVYVEPAPVQVVASYPVSSGTSGYVVAESPASPYSGLTEYERYRLALESNDTLELARILGGYYSKGVVLSNDVQSQNTSYGTETGGNSGGGDTYNINIYVDEWGNPYYSDRLRYSYYGGWGTGYNYYGGNFYDPWFYSSGYNYSYYDPFFYRPYGLWNNTFYSGWYGYGYNNWYGYNDGWYGGNYNNYPQRPSAHGVIARRGDSGPLDNTRGASPSRMGSGGRSSASGVSWDEYRPSQNRSGVRAAALNQVRNASSGAPAGASRQLPGQSSATRAAANSNAPSTNRPVTNIDAYNRQASQNSAASQNSSVNRQGGTPSYSRPSSGQVYNDGNAASNRTSASPSRTTPAATTTTKTTTTTSTSVPNTRATSVQSTPSYSAPSYSAPSYSAPSSSAPSSYSGSSSSSGGGSSSSGGGGSSSSGGGSSRR